MKLQKITASRRLRMGGLSTALVLVVVAAMLLLNLTASVLTEKFPLSLDLTRDKIFELSQESKDFAASLTEPVQIKVLATEEAFVSSSTYNAQANTVIKSYAQYGGAITISYVDYMRDPSFAARYPDLKLTHGDILLLCGDRTRVLHPYDLFNYTQDARGQLKIASSRAEQTMTSALMAVTSAERVKLAVLSGHGEYTMDDFTGLLADNNYELLPTNLATQEIDPAAKGALLFCPKNDLSPEALARLDRFLQNEGAYGKLLFVTADTMEQPALPNLEAFLTEWGITVGEGAVFETDAGRVYNYDPFYPVTDYVDPQFSEGILSPDMRVLVPLSKPIGTLWEYRDAYATRVLLQYGESAGVRPVDAGEQYDVQRDTRQWGPFPALVLSTKTEKTTELGASPKASHVLVSGSTGLVDAYAIGSPSFTNAEYLLNVLNTLTERGDVIRVKSKTITGDALGVTKAQADGLGILFVAVLPLLILGTGVGIWLYRRHK